jgi:hypothetical protein
MPLLKRYRIWCNTEEAYVYVWATSQPTLCPTNPVHEINISRTATVERAADDEVLNNLDAEAEPTTANDDSQGYALGSLWAYDGVLYACTSAATGAAQWVRISDLPIISAGESDGISQTTNVAFTNKLRVTTPSLKAGDYYVTFYYELTTDGNSKIAYGRVMIDATEAANHTRTNATAGEYTAVGGYRRVPLSAGVHTLDVDFAAAAGQTCSIKRARLSIRRV